MRKLLNTIKSSFKTAKINIESVEKKHDTRIEVVILPEVVSNSPTIPFDEMEYLKEQAILKEERRRQQEEINRKKEKIELMKKKKEDEKKRRLDASKAKEKPKAKPKAKRK